nr:hypothetical protein [uncultured Agathobaculum sp.]
MNIAAWMDSFAAAVRIEACGIYYAYAHNRLPAWSGGLVQTYAKYG